MTGEPARPAEPVTEAPPRVDLAAASAWSPLRNALFRSLWIATIVSNVGTWMQDVGAGWLMTSLSSSPSMVALVEAADSIPMMLLALPAGALADIVDRRRLLIFVQVYLLAVAGTLGVLTLLGMTTAWMLLGFVFAMGVGAAVTVPAWAAIVPDLVPAEELSSAIALNSIAINISRAIGPAIAGVLVAAVGPWLVFILNALSYIGIIAVLFRWRREHRKSTLPAERFVSAIRVGMRFVLHTRSLQAVLVRRRVLRVRQRDVGIVSADRPSRARPRARDLRLLVDLHRRRRRRGRDGSASGARQGIARRARRRCKCSLCRRHA